jgi:hypothetical protein
VFMYTGSIFRREIKIKPRAENDLTLQ